MDDNEQKILAFPPAAPGYTPSKLPFFVVGIGASAGGLVAITRFIEAMPADNGMAFVIVVDLSPEHESQLAGILQRKTRMPVLQVTETVPIESNHLYIIPPKNDLLMNDGHLQLAPTARPKSYHGEIDLFLRALAEVHREGAIGIILSGAGTDGAVGIARIKEKGGIAIAQSLDDAEYDSMPRSAIDTGMIDIVLPAAEMPQRLIAVMSGAAFGVLIGVSRLMVNAHSPSEAIAGWLLGAMVSTAFLAMMPGPDRPCLEIRPAQALPLLLLLLLPVFTAKPAPTERWLRSVAMTLSGHETLNSRGYRKGQESI